MVEIETFLRAPDGGFVRVEACHGPPPDPDYIEGAIRLSVDGRELIGLREWDYVDQLWCYVAEMASRLRSTGRAETYFPDQPIRLSFQESGSRVVVTVKSGGEVKKAIASSADLLNSLRTAGLSFFDKMSELVPGLSYAEARKRLSA
ncbi:hypothetical protein [Streptomyces similanensis]|uniref:YbjN domain-containing protein n=1 Tax=Streptomyces similanensis TaxID=1274988 RepID=A0ABP9LG54_9ACTN|nr:hypothetical protein HUT11_01515 [Streptomyces seoulensis]